jgi:hypothetical protein
MQDMARNVRRTHNGSIDYAHYDRLARRLRGRVTHRSIAGQRNALLLVLGAALNAARYSIGVLAGAIFKASRWAVNFWNIPPLGSVDLRVGHGVRPN